MYGRRKATGVESCVIKILFTRFMPVTVRLVLSYVRFASFGQQAFGSSTHPKALRPGLCAVLGRRVCTDPTTDPPADAAAAESASCRDTPTPTLLGHSFAAAVPIGGRSAATGLPSAGPHRYPRRPRRRIAADRRRM